MSPPLVDEDHNDESSFGPVGLLLKDLRACGYDMSDELVITAPGEAPINVRHMPWQHLKPAVQAIAIRQRTIATNGKRTFCGNLTELDQPMIKTIVNKLAPKELRVYRHIATGGF